MPAAPLRILVVLPMYGGSLPIGRYCASALSALGHSVRVFDAPLLHAGFTGLRCDTMRWFSSRKGYGNQPSNITSWYCRGA